MKVRTTVIVVFFAMAAAGALAAAAVFREAHPNEFDPAKSALVNAAWIDGAGCPSNAVISSDGSSTQTPYPAANCPDGDPTDSRNAGLIFIKSGPQANYAEPYAELKELKGSPITELGYDLRKPGAINLDPRGSQCSAEAPMFQLEMSDGHVYFVACTSPPPTTQAPVGLGWLRLRWGAGGEVLGYQDGAALMPIPGTVVHAYIVFQDGQDSGPEQFGLAVIDNIDVNGAIVGKGATEADVH